MRLSIDEKLLNKIANYLGTKPFQEVFQLVQEIQQDIKPIDDTTKHTTDETAKDNE